MAHKMKKKYYSVAAFCMMLALASSCSGHDDLDVVVASDEASCNSGENVTKSLFSSAESSILLILNSMGYDSVSRESRFLEDLSMDYSSYSYLLRRVSDEFDVVLGTSSFSSVGALVSYVDDLIRPRPVRVRFTTSLGVAEIPITMSCSADISYSNCERTVLRRNGAENPYCYIEVLSPVSPEFDVDEYIVILNRVTSEVDGFITVRWNVHLDVLCYRNDNTVRCLTYSLSLFNNIATGDTWSTPPALVFDSGRPQFSREDVSISSIVYRSVSDVLGVHEVRNDMSINGYDEDVLGELEILLCERLHVDISVISAESVGDLVELCRYAYDCLGCISYLPSANIYDRILITLAQFGSISISSIRPDSSFEDLGFESIDSLMLCSDLEDEFGIQIPVEHMFVIFKYGVQELYDYILSYPIL